MEETTIVDKTDDYPTCDSKIDSIEAGQVESLWVTDQTEHLIAKSWNALVQIIWLKTVNQLEAQDI